MIKFNWQYIKNMCGFDPINILQYLCFKENLWLPSYLPKNYPHHIYQVSKTPYPIGDSYILNIKPILMNQKGFFVSDIYNYIQLASCRSYFDYKVKNITTLPVVIAKANSMDLNNPLIKVIDENIHFKYETETTGVNK
jgi:hypothetical protein